MCSFWATLDMERDTATCTMRTYGILAVGRHQYTSPMNTAAERRVFFTYLLQDDGISATTENRKSQAAVKSVRSIKPHGASASVIELISGTAAAAATAPVGVWRRLRHRRRSSSCRLRETSALRQRPGTAGRPVLSCFETFMRFNGCSLSSSGSAKSSVYCRADQSRRLDKNRTGHKIIINGQHLYSVWTVHGHRTKSYQHSTT